MKPVHTYKSQSMVRRSVTLDQPARIAPFESQDLRLVAALVEHGGMTAAAPYLNATQSTLSHQLKSLERRMGIALFDRVGRKLLPTAGGELLAMRAGGILDSLRVARDEAMGAPRSRGLHVRLATECHTCYHWLPAVLRSFATGFPGVQVRVVGEATSDALRAVQDGAIDVCVAFSAVRNRNLRSRKLFDDEVVVVVAPQHRLAGHTRIDASDLTGENIYSYDGPANSSVFHSHLRPAGILPHQVTRVSLTEATVELVKAGLGVAFLARWAVAPELRARNLVALPFGAAGLRRAWRVVTRVRPRPPKHLDAFVTFLQRELHGYGTTSASRRPLR